MNTFKEIISGSDFSHHDIKTMLSSEGEERNLLFTRAAKIKEELHGNKVYFRGLIEFSNICQKNCYYCGIRKGNSRVNRYNLSDDDILEAARFAYENKYSSIVLQSGEIASESFTKRIENLLKLIMKLSNNQLRITLSLGEQTKDTYQRWFDSGAKRYLLRIETSNKEFYSKLHPSNKNHSFAKRLESLYLLQDTGYQTGTGVMIGLPFQTIDDLANDLLFMKNFNIDMVGMGPYIEHYETPLFKYKNILLPPEERFDLTLRMIAALRIIMPGINIASATALQAIDKLGREKAIKVGANVIMPNITPGTFRDDYRLYNNKPCTEENADDCTNCLETRIAITSHQVAYGEWGDSMHYKERTRS